MNWSPETNGYPRPEIRVFVASSGKSVPVANALKDLLASEEVKIIPWKDVGVFVLSDSIIESLERAVSECHFAVFILGQDDVIQTTYGGVYVPRDNVVFELGLFLGRIGRQRSYMLRPEGVDVKLPSDLGGVNWASYRLPGTTIDDVRNASENIRYAMSVAPMMPTVSLLSRTIFPPIVLKHALSTFLRYNEKSFFSLRNAAFNCDAQLTICTRNGVIVRHPRISSIGKKLDPHEGKILWSTFPFSEADRPFNLLFSHSDKTGWVVWADSGYSQMYEPISGRHNHRICIARSLWTSRRISFLEIHHELTGEIELNHLKEIGYVIGKRILDIEEER